VGSLIWGLIETMSEVWPADTKCGKQGQFWKVYQRRCNNNKRKCCYVNSGELVSVSEWHIIRYLTRCYFIVFQMHQGWRYSFTKKSIWVACLKIDISMLLFNFVFSCRQGVMKLLKHWLLKDYLQFHCMVAAVRVKERLLCITFGVAQPAFW
jgi:hypothetical protein